MGEPANLDAVYVSAWGDEVNLLVFCATHSAGAALYPKTARSLAALLLCAADQVEGNVSNQSHNAKVANATPSHNGKQVRSNP